MSETSGRRIRSVNPFDDSLIAEYEPHDRDTVNAALDRSHSAFERRRSQAPETFHSKLHTLAAALRANADELAALITREMGKPLQQAASEVEKSARVCEFYADHAADMLAAEPVDIDGRDTYVQFLPLGPILAVMPWNYPLWQVLRAAAPILSSGNTLLVKHAENVSGCALALQKVFEEAGLGDGVVQTLLINGPRASEIIGDDRIAAVTLTGSERAGVAVGTASGQAIKKCVLELGGSDAFIVLNDADIEEAARVAVNARFQNAGQSCVAAKRFIVVDSVAEEFITQFVNGAAKLVTGDPTVDGTDVGPMARRDLRDELADQVQRGIDSGDRVLLGGLPDDAPGAFYPPTIIEVAGPQSPLMQEETFGPVAAIVRVPDERAAIALANSSRYGLSSSLWTTDPERAARVTRQLDAGGCFVNTMTASDPRIPFGGVKKSGYGRELGAFGLREFVNVQTVSIAH